MRCMLHPAFCTLRPAVLLHCCSLLSAMPCHAVLCRARPGHALTTSHFVSKMAPFLSFPTLTESRCNHYSQSRRLNLVVPDCFVRSEVHPTIPSTRPPTPTCTLHAFGWPRSQPGPPRGPLIFFLLLLLRPRPPGLPGLASSFIGRPFPRPHVPASLPTWLHTSDSTYPVHHSCCYRSVGSSGTQSTIASQTVKAAISLSPGDGTLVLKRGHVRTTTCSLTSFLS